MLYQFHRSPCCGMDNLREEVFISVLGSVPPGQSKAAHIMGQEAERGGAGTLLVSHHPLVFHTDPHGVVFPHNQ